MQSELKIEQLKTVNNPNSIHGIYPYRGKISALDAKSIVSQLSKDRVLLDPFCGSGTIVYEAAVSGLHSVGVDSNPLANWLTQGKTSLISGKAVHSLTELEEIFTLARSSNKGRSTKDSELLNKAFHPDTLDEINSFVPFFDEMNDYLKAVFLGSLALTARGCNNYLWTSSSVGKDIQPKRYIDFFDKFEKKAKKHFAPQKVQSKIKVYHKDSRVLSRYIKEKSIDYVFTSPPYFDALDYTAYYGQIIYELFDLNRVEIKKNLIQNAKRYEEDMKKVLDEIVRVTTDDALIIFVVGDKKVGSEVINGGDFFSNLLHHKPNTVLERSYTGTSSQIFDALNKTERKEQIVIWDKKTWK
jgi:16S rRNA G966 N2-methylase RsmD